ncbi:MAG: hypothetical protein WC222_11770 [Parachlamydiales bacterium]|jgi:hypothetical protein
MNSITFNTCFPCTFFDSAKQSILKYKRLATVSFSYCHQQIALFIKCLFIKFKTPNPKTIQAVEIGYLAAWQVKQLASPRQNYPILSTEVRLELVKRCSDFTEDQWLMLCEEQELPVIIEAKTHLSEMQRVCIASFQQNEVHTEYDDYDLYPDYCATSPLPKNLFQGWIANLSCESLVNLLVEYTNSFEHIQWVWESLSKEKKEEFVLQLSKHKVDVNKLNQLTTYLLNWYQESFFDACNAKSILVSEIIESLYTGINNRNLSLKTRLSNVDLLNGLHARIIAANSFVRYTRIDRELPKGLESDNSLLGGIFNEMYPPVEPFYVRKIIEKSKRCPNLFEWLHNFWKEAPPQNQYQLQLTLCRYYSKAEIETRLNTPKEQYHNSLGWYMEQTRPDLAFIHKDKSEE